MWLVLKNALFTVLVPGTVGVYLPYLLTRQAQPGGRLALAAGCLLFLVGAATYFWCLRDFAVHGRATPAPIDAPKQLVLRGLYRYTRNPMYVGVLLAIAGWAVAFASLGILGYGLAVAMCIHFFVVFYEEPHLRGLFGTAYDTYCKQVARWLPRRYP